jgi:hypothetical protein
MYSINHINRGKAVILRHTNNVKKPNVVPAIFKKLFSQENIITVMTGATLAYYLTQYLTA